MSLSSISEAAAGQSPEIILASASPRRRLLLELLGIPHCVKAAEVDERALKAASPREFALKAAYVKAGALDALLPTGTLVIAADTVVALGDTKYFKPQDAADAQRMLTELSGKEHQVITAVAVREVGKATQLEAVRTDVQVRLVSDREIAGYVATGEPLDKAGAYGIQGLGGQLVERIAGDYFNVVGLPVDKLLDMLSVHIDVALYRDARRKLTPQTFEQHCV